MHIALETSQRRTELGQPGGPGGDMLGSGGCREGVAVMVAGENKRMKTARINALSGRTGLLPTNIAPSHASGGW